MEDEKLIRFVGRMMPVLNEKQRRIFLGCLSDFLGRGTATKLQSITKVSRVTINRGRAESEQIQEDPRARPKSSELAYTRRPVAGRKSVVERYPDIKEALLTLLDGNIIDNPENPLCWTTKSLRNLESALKQMGYGISFSSISRRGRDQLL